MNTQLNLSKTSRRVFTRSVALTSILLSMGSAGFAQVAADESALRQGGKFIDIPCCQCLDGKETVIDLSTGTAPWTGGAGNNPASANGAVSNVAPAGPWASSPPAQWISTGATDKGFYTYKLLIRNPKNCVIPMRVSMEGKAWGDDIFTMKLNGSPIGSSSNPAVVANAYVGGTWPTSPSAAGSYGGFGSSNVLTINSTTLPNGVIQLIATVDNAGGPTGFLFNGKLTVKCSTELKR